MTRNDILWTLIGAAATACIYLWWAHKKKEEPNEESEKIMVEDEGNEEQAESPDLQNSFHLPPKEDISVYARKLQEERYTKYSDSERLEQPDEGTNLQPDPYVISPQEFAAEDEEYETLSLVYYSDGVLAFEIDDTPIEDVKGTVGDAVSHFGEYDDNIVYVRDEANKRDYEIARDLRRYADIYPDNT